MNQVNTKEMVSNYLFIQQVSGCQENLYHENISLLKIYNITFYMHCLGEFYVGKDLLKYEKVGR